MVLPEGEGNVHVAKQTRKDSIDIILFPYFSQLRKRVYMWISKVLELVSIVFRLSIVFFFFFWSKPEAFVRVRMGVLAMIAKWCRIFISSSIRLLYIISILPYKHFQQCRCRWFDNFFWWWIIFPLCCFSPYFFSPQRSFSIKNIPYLTVLE